MKHALLFVFVFNLLFVNSFSQEAPTLEQALIYEATPRYLALIFGEENEDKMWLILDGEDVLYADCNMDGRIDPEKEKFPVGDHPKFANHSYVLIPEVKDPNGTRVATQLELTRFGEGEKSDIVKVKPGGILPLMRGWKPLFKDDLSEAKPVRFSGLVRPGYLRSKEVSLSDEKAEVHLYLYSKAAKGEFAALVGNEAYPEDAKLVATIHWPTEGTVADPVTSDVQLTERC